jgi:hypothetical protein
MLTRRMDCRIKSAMTTRRSVLAMRFAPELLFKLQSFRSPRRSSSENAGGGCRYAHDQNFKPRNVRKKKRKAERRSTRVRIHRTLRCGARFAKRARQSAFHHGSDLRDYSSQRLTSGQASCRTALTRRDPRQPVRHIQRCTSRTGRNAGGLMPETPGSGGDEPPRAGTASHSGYAESPHNVLHGERD